MSNMTAIEAKAFVPARDFALSKKFYQDLGFDLAWSSEDLAYLRHGNATFLLRAGLEQVDAVFAGLARGARLLQDAVPSPGRRRAGGSGVSATRPRNSGHLPETRA